MTPQLSFTTYKLKNKNNNNTEALWWHANNLLWPFVTSKGPS